MRFGDLFLDVAEAILADPGYDGAEIGRLSDAGVLHHEEPTGQAAYL